MGGCKLFARMSKQIREAILEFYHKKGGGVEMYSTMIAKQVPFPILHLSKTVILTVKQ